MDRRKAQCFEELAVFQEARSLTNRVYEITRRLPFNRDYGLVGQIRRACVSIVSNIAEGYERGSRTEFVQFLYVAKGSCGEVRAQLLISHDQRYVSDDEFQEIQNQCRRISSMLSNFILTLQRSDYKGEKYDRGKQS